MAIHEEQITLSTDRIAVCIAENRPMGGYFELRGCAKAVQTASLAARTRARLSNHHSCYSDSQFVGMTKPA